MGLVCWAILVFEYLADLLTECLRPDPQSALVDAGALLVMDGTDDIWKNTPGYASHSIEGHS